MAKKLSPIRLKVRIPHVVIDVRDGNAELAEEMVSGLEELDARVKILGDGAKILPHAFSTEEALEEAHIWVFLSDRDPKDLPMIIERGIVPVMLNGAHPLAENYDAVNEKGNAFLFPKLSKWHIYGTLVRALENFNFSHDWENLRNHGKELLPL